jgi:glucose-6-phosphate 1-dehydrogenase
LDTITGDASLFTRADEVETAWGIIDPILQAWEDPAAKCLSRSTNPDHAPSEADELLAKEA